jgi:hypothetical protein
MDQTPDFFQLDVRTMTDQLADEPGYYDFRATALAHPQFITLLVEELQALRYMHSRATPVTVYFVQQGPDGPIKIGASRNFAKRLKTLNTSSHVPLTVLGVTAGGYELEAALHRELREHQMSGEWFQPTPEVLSAVRRYA